jgi:ATP synthase protein I
MDEFTRAIVRGAALPTAVAGVLATAVAGIVGGAPAAVGAGLGTTVVIVFFMAGQLVLASVLRSNPAMGMSVAMVLYLLKIGVLLALLLLLQGVTAFDTKAFAFTILVCTLVWTAAEVWVFSRSHVLVMDADPVPPAVQRYAQENPVRDDERESDSA